MKKHIGLLIALALALSLSACGKQEPAASESSPVQEQSSESSEVQSSESSDAQSAVGQEAADLTILLERDDSMKNTYSMIAVNPQAEWKDIDGNPIEDVAALNTEGADALINWMLSEGKQLAGKYGFDIYNEYLFYELEDGASSSAEIPQATEETKTIRMSTTTSVNDSGLLASILPEFEKKYGYHVEIFSAGTGKAIANAKSGNADLLLVHSKSQEEKFIEEGYARVIDSQDRERLSFLYNFFVLCGPSADPAGVAKSESVSEAFGKIAEGEYLFVSRGDGSGTHSKELSLWPEKWGITAEPESFAAYSKWYISSNAGMGAALLQARERGAYILSDKATFLTFVTNNEAQK